MIRNRKVKPGNQQRLSDPKGTQRETEEYHRKLQNADTSLVESDSLVHEIWSRSSSRDA